MFRYISIYIILGFERLNGFINDFEKDEAKGKRDANSHAVSINEKIKAKSSPESTCCHWQPYV